MNYQKLPLKKFPFNFELKENYSLFGKPHSKVLINNCNMSDIFDFYSKNPLLDSGNSCNDSEFKKSLYDDSNKFRGGSFDDIFKDKNLDLLNKYETDTFKNFSNGFAELKVRSRVRSEYDGDFDYDKRYDIAPFFNRGKIITKRKSLKIFGEVSFSASTSAEDIDNYGAFVVALVNHFEKIGINIDLYATRTADRTTSGNLFVDRTITHIKSPGSYLPKLEMLKIFNSVYFRRIGFTQIVASAQYMNKEIYITYGCPYSFGSTFKYLPEENELHIFSNPSFRQQKDIVKLLEKELLT